MRAHSRRRRVLMVAGIVLATVAVSALAALQLINDRARFVTWQGIGPDKWASVWLIRRHLDPEAIIDLREPRAPVDGGVAFDVPDAFFKRDSTNSAFARMREAYRVDDPAVLQLAQIINQIEISGWQVRAFTPAAQVEAAFRGLQRTFGREQVPFGCYLALFDRVYAVLADPAGDLAAMAPEQLTPQVDCELSTELAGAQQALVAELGPRAILARVARGDKVVFVDTREDDEYASGHIPGAVSLKLRDVDERSAASLASADLVVPYCVKDFRGFEVARALQKIGLTRVAIMNPYGIRGWRSLGLPVTEGLADGGALARLEACALDPDPCLAAP